MFPVQASETVPELHLSLAEHLLLVFLCVQVINMTGETGHLVCAQAGVLARIETDDMDMATRTNKK